MDQQQPWRPEHLFAFRMPGGSIHVHEEGHVACSDASEDEFNTLLANDIEQAHCAEGDQAIPVPVYTRDPRDKAEIHRLRQLFKKLDAIVMDQIAEQAVGRVEDPSEILRVDMTEADARRLFGGMSDIIAEALETEEGTR